VAIEWTQTIDNLFTSTWAYRRPRAVEQAFLKTPLIAWLRQRGQVENQAGHTRIEIPLAYGSNEAVRWIGRGGTVPITDFELLTMAYEEWKYVAVPIVRFNEDDQKNRGRAQLLRLVEHKVSAAERALNEEFERVFFADGTGTREPNGLQNIVAKDPTTGTLHGINRATYSWFRNQSKASSGAASVYLLSDMRNLLNTCLKYSVTELTDYILITDQATFELYEEEVVEMRQIVNERIGDTEFEGVRFRGRTMFWSPSAPAGNIYFINTNNLKLVIDDDYFMQMTEWKSIPDQVGDRVAQILCTCNLVSDRPVVHGVLTGVSA